MIAKTKCCTREELESLLRDSIDAQTAEQFTEHVETCAKCHQNLMKMAGNDQWWSDSKNYLASIEAATEGSGFFSQPTEPKPQHVPNQLGHYRIESVVGFGGMATVYRALDLELNRPVAVKVLHHHLSASGNSRQRFLREAQSAAAIAHPNVIPIYGVHNLEGYSFLVMPLVLGGSLQQRIDREGPLSLIDVLRIGLQIAEALDSAHSHGVIHRDVKPANILLEDGSLRVLLSDFGLARTLDDSTLTASGMIAGTPAFMSPEQARGEAIDFRSDLYSLGSVMFSMATGHAPYQSPSTLKLLRAVGSEPFPSVHRYQEQLPIWFDKLIGLLTTADAVKRLPNAKAVADIMRQALAYCSNPKSNKLPEVLVSQTFPSLPFVSDWLVGRSLVHKVARLSVVTVGLLFASWFMLTWIAGTRGTANRNVGANVLSSASNSREVNRGMRMFPSNNGASNSDMLKDNALTNDTSSRIQYGNNYPSPPGAVVQPIHTGNVNADWHSWDDGLDATLSRIEGDLGRLREQDNGFDSQGARIGNEAPLGHVQFSGGVK